MLIELKYIHTKRLEGVVVVATKYPTILLGNRESITHLTVEGGQHQGGIRQLVVLFLILFCGELSRYSGCLYKLLVKRQK